MSSRVSGAVAVVSAAATILGYIFWPAIGAVSVFVCIYAVRENMYATNGWGAWK